VLSFHASWLSHRLYGKSNGNGELGQIVAEWTHIDVDQFTLNGSVNK
jgi:hypothetical protein